MSILNEKVDVRFVVILLMIFAVAFLRLVPHPLTFAPLGAMALFGAAYFKSRPAAFLVPLAALWLSDLAVTNIVHSDLYPSFTLFYDGFYWVYGATLLTTVLGFFLLNKISIGRVAGSAILAAVLFFLVTNFGSWLYEAQYSKDLSGLMASYVAGIPFFRGTLAGNLLYSAILFGGFELAKRQIAVLRTSPASA